MRCGHRTLERPLSCGLTFGFAASALVGLALERLLYRRFYRRSHLDQVLLTIGQPSVSIVNATLFGPQQPLRYPVHLLRSLSVLGVDLNIYRMFLLAVGVALHGAA